MKLPAFLPERVALALWSLILFTVCYTLTTRHNTFPFYYHPDEPGKAEQVLTGDWNYHHPMLLLTTSNAVVKLFGVPRDEQSVVEAGRRVSAAFMAAGVVLLSLLAFLWRGWFAAFASGAALTLHHQLYELGHYMKEDSALLFGMACAFLAAMSYAQKPSGWRAAVLGAGCALAISGKFIGVLALAVAAPVLWVYSPGQLGKRWGIFLAAFAGVLVLVNLPLLLDFSAFRQSFDREVNLVVEGQGDVTRRVPHALYWNIFLDNSTPVVWVFLVGFVVISWHRRDSLNLAEALILLFPFVFTIMLSFSPKENDRYFLPASALFTMFAAIGVQDAPRLLFRLADAVGLPDSERFLDGRMRLESVLASTVLLLLLQFTGWSSTKPGWLQYDWAFQHDDLADLVAWMRSDLPPQAVVVADSRVGLPDPKRKKHAARAQVVPQKLTVSKLAADKGTLDELRAQGVTHVAVSESSYGKFFRGDLRAKDENDPKFSRAKAFYEQLLREGEPVFERDRSTVIYLHPGIRVYRISEVPH